MGICHSLEYNDNNSKLFNYDSTLLEYNVLISNASSDLETTNIINKFEKQFETDINKLDKTIMPFYIGMLKKLCMIRSEKHICLDFDLMKALNIGIIFINLSNNNHLNDNIYHINEYITDMIEYNINDFNTINDWFVKLYPENHETMKTLYLENFYSNFKNKNLDIYITSKSGNSLFFGFHGCKTDKTVCWIMVKKDNTITKYNSLIIELDQIKIIEKMVFNNFNKDFISISSNTHFKKLSLKFLKKIDWRLNTITKFNSDLIMSPSQLC